MGWFLSAVYGSVLVYVMRILFINFADDGGVGGLGSTTVERLRKRADKPYITCIQSVDAERGELLPIHDSLAASSDALEDIEYDQIVIAAHGQFGDVDHCYYRPKTAAINMQIRQLVSFKELADFCCTLLTKAGVIHSSRPNLDILFAVCYGARTREYQRDHVTEAAGIDYKHSFVGQFLEHFHHITDKHYTITAHGCTGSVKFHEGSGELLVETEELIQYKESRVRQAQLYNKAFELLEVAFADDPEQSEKIDAYIGSEAYKKDETECDRAWIEYLRLEAENTQKEMTVVEYEPNYGTVAFRIGSGIALKAELSAVPEDEAAQAAEAAEAADAVEPTNDEETPLLHDSEPRHGFRCCNIL